MNASKAGCSILIAIFSLIGLGSLAGLSGTTLTVGLVGAVVSLVIGFKFTAAADGWTLRTFTQFLLIGAACQAAMWVAVVAQYGVQVQLDQALIGLVKIPASFLFWCAVTTPWRREARTLANTTVEAE